MKTYPYKTDIIATARSINTMKDFCYSFKRNEQFNYESLLPIKIKRLDDMNHIIDKYYKIC